MSFADTVVLVEVIVLAEKLGVKAFGSVGKTNLSKVARAGTVSFAIDID